jgi:8-oxo-dGTP pyrophosphatase MutT (NUDIX family)
MTLLEQLEKYKPYNDEEAVIKPIILDFLAQNDDAFCRENLLAHMTASAWIVNKERTKVLMAYHNIYNSWGWLGGHADGDEDLLRVIRKEVAEESGLTNIRLLYDGIYGINILTVFPHYKRGKYVNAHLHFDVEYLFEADEEEAVRMKPDENSGVGWVSIEEINQRVTEEHMKPVYAVLNEKLKQV